MINKFIHLSYHQAEMTKILINILKFIMLTENGKNWHLGAANVTGFNVQAEHDLLCTWPVYLSRF